MFVLCCVICQNDIILCADKQGNSDCAPDWKCHALSFRMLAGCCEELCGASGVTSSPSQELVKPPAHKSMCGCLLLLFRHRNGPADCTWGSHTHSTGKTSFWGHGVLESSGSRSAEATGRGGCQTRLAAALAMAAGAEAALAVRQMDKC